MDLKYKKLISKELEDLEHKLNESINSDIDLATEVSNYLVSSGGKELGPLFVY